MIRLVKKTSSERLSSLQGVVVMIQFSMPLPALADIVVDEGDADAAAHAHRI
jgi:hypothetical protein